MSDLTPDQIAAFRARLLALRNKSARVADVARQIAEEAEDLWLDLATEVEQPGTLKRTDGRLSDEGVRAVNAAFQAGSTVTEVARTFGISASAASQRRKIWMAAKFEATA